MHYVWDPAKDALNRRKHGLRLAEGIPALEDPEYGEERIITLGLTGKGILYVVSTEPQKECAPGSSPSEKQKEARLSGMAWVEHNPGDPPIETNTDWERVNAMTDEEIRDAALSDPDAQPIPAGTDDELAKIGLHRIVNAKRLRERLGLSQEAFAARYRIPIGTLRDWEQRRKLPDAPARAYLLVIEKDPDAVARLLGESAA